MTREELSQILTRNNAAIIAPAGHGKTEMIVDIVKQSSGKQLLLTHTHAGVNALKKRLDRKKVPHDKYSLSTIAGFCTKWGLAYFNTGNIDKSLSPNSKKKAERDRYYAQFYEGTKVIFSNQWAKEILITSYSGIIVDEYQDCTLTHHEIFKELNTFLPVIVLGDPLQGIFAFREPIVDWNNLGYDIVSVDTYPWRWKDSNPELGEYLAKVRTDLWPTLSGKNCTLNIQPCSGSVSVIDPTSFQPYALLNELADYKSVLYITKWEPQQLDFCKQMPGIFQLDEKQECTDLFNYAKKFDVLSDSSLALSIIQFESKCATKVTTELSSYIKHLEDGSFDFGRIKKYTDFGDLLIKFRDYNKHDAIRAICSWIEKNTEFKFCRKELHREMLHSVNFAQENGISIEEAANRIRKDVTLQKRYTDFKFLSSRTLLSKGLEFDCVIIDGQSDLTAKEFYVAMTRAMKKIYIINASSTILLKP